MCFLIIKIIVMKKIFIPLVFLFGLIYSCSKDNINVTVGNEQGQDTYLGGSSSDSTSTSTNTVDSTSKVIKLLRCIMMPMNIQCIKEQIQCRE